MYKLPFLFLIFGFIGCSTITINKNPIGDTFPKIEGKSLDGQFWSFPDDLEGKNVLLLIGYKQETQFDIDRWLIGIDQKKYNINIFEVPTIEGWVPRIIAGKIDGGMRAGIPKELWKIVVTIYKDADKVVGFLGNENPLNARAVVIDKMGKVRFIHDKGFSVDALNKLSKYFPSSLSESCK